MALSVLGCAAAAAAAAEAVAVAAVALVAEAEEEQAVQTEAGEFWAVSVVSDNLYTNQDK